MQVSTFFTAVLAVCVVVVTAVYVNDHVTCFNFLGVTKGCVTH